MNYNYRYRLDPSEDQRETLDRHRDICRQVYNHGLTRLDQLPEDTGTVHQRVTRIRDELPDLKDWWTDLTDVYSTAPQAAVERIETNITNLGKLKEQGYEIGELRWKGPHEYRSFTYRQSGFDVDENTGREGRGELHLSKVGSIPIRLHRDIPDDATIKQVTLKKEKTGDWVAVFGIERDRNPPEKPDTPERCVGIDVGILKYVHDTDGFAVGSLDLSDERERLEREQRNLARKERGSNNWEQQRQKVAECHQRIKRKRRDFLHRLSAYYAREYDLVAVEDLNVKGMLEDDSNSRNTASASWHTFKRMLEYKCEREGTHFVAVDPEGSTKECASCGVETDKPLWIREHSCPACGFEADRDGNAAWNILSRGLTDVGVVHSEETPVETALPTGATVVPAKRVVEAGSPALQEPPKAASRAG